jgi:hypothetical protein
VIERVAQARPHVPARASPLSLVHTSPPLQEFSFPPAMLHLSPTRPDHRNLRIRTGMHARRAKRPKIDGDTISWQD